MGQFKNIAIDQHNAGWDVDDEYDACRIAEHEESKRPTVIIAYHDRTESYAFQSDDEAHAFLYAALDRAKQLAIHIASITAIDADGIPVTGFHGVTS